MLGTLAFGFLVRDVSERLGRGLACPGFPMLGDDGSLPLELASGWLRAAESSEGCVCPDPFCAMEPCTVEHY
jgi:hypothetical protein